MSVFLVEPRELEVSDFRPCRPQVQLSCVSAIGTAQSTRKKLSESLRRHGRNVGAFVNIYLTNTDAVNNTRKAQISTIFLLPRKTDTQIYTFIDLQMFM